MGLAGGLASNGQAGSSGGSSVVPNARQVLGSESALGTPCCTNSNSPVHNSSLKDGTNFGGTTRMECYAVRRAFGARLVFAGFYGSNPNDLTGMQPLTIAGSIEDNSANFYPATFGGQHYATLAKDGLVVTDVIGIDFNAGDKLWLRTYYATPNTTLNGSVTLPQATITVTSTASGVFSNGAPFPAFDPNGGQIMIGGQTVTYTGLTATTFTGCTGGAGTFASGNVTAKTPATGFASLGGEACALSATAPLDQTLGGTVTQAGGVNDAFMPLCVLGGGPRQPCVLGVMDSYGDGLQDSGTRNNGVLRRALIPGVSVASAPETTATNASPGVGHVMAAMSQEKAQTAAVAANRKYRAKLFQFCTHAVVNYGTNDLNSARTLAQLQADLITVWGALANRGLLVYQTTIPPRTTSSDSWATTANQTPVLHMAGGTTLSSGITTAAQTSLPVAALPSQWANNTVAVVSDGAGHQDVFTVTPLAAAGAASLTVTSHAPGVAYSTGARVDTYRTALNYWLRNGAPVNASLVAQPVGTAGALVAGQAGHPLQVTYFEIATSLESALDSGVWIVNGAANFSTADGVHPSAAFYQTAANAIPLATFT